MNIAQRHLDYYESEDFEAQYAFWLYEKVYLDAYHLQELWNIGLAWTYYWERPPLGLSFMDRATAGAVCEYLLDTSPEVRRFRHYWVGNYALGSIPFGEQEVQLEGIYNYRTGREYTLPYLRRVFNEEGFYVSGRYAYLDLSSEGVYIDFRDFEKETILEALQAAKAVEVPE